MRKATTHVALDREPNRFTIHERTHVLSIHDRERGLEFPLYSHGQSRHDAGWTGQEAAALADWLNERAAGYPRSPNIDHQCKLKGEVLHPLNAPLPIP
jgi:hypothetical protein